MANESFPHQQDELFPEPAQPEFDASTVAARIANAAPKNPYKAQDERAAKIIENRGEDLAAEQLGRPPETGPQPSTEAERRLHEGHTGHPRNRPEQRYWKRNVETDPVRRQEIIAKIKEVREDIKRRNGRKG
jgi:hypothetical protein